MADNSAWPDRAVKPRSRALEMSGPMPGTVISLRQLSSLLASVSISSVTVSIRSSSCRQSPLPDDDAALQEKAANLIDHCGPFADKARPHPVQRLQIKSLIGLGWNKARRRSLHGLGHSMSISKVILVSLPKRPRICRRNLLHVVARRCKLLSNVVVAIPASMPIRLRCQL